MQKQNKAIVLTVTETNNALVAKASSLFAIRFRDRTKVRLQEKLNATATAALWSIDAGTVQREDLRADLQAAGLPVPVARQSYVLATLGQRLVVCGADGLGVLYGLGHLLRILEFTPARVKLPQLRETRTPAVYDRGVYFATHFNQYFESAPIDRLERYVEEMALAGFDRWMFWLDLNWFPYGFWKDSRSRGSILVKRLRRMSEVARACGMKVIATGIGNEGFSHQPPPELRTDIRGRHGGFYPDSQICPSKPGGLEMILNNRRKAMELLGPVDTYVHWPYDQGGCGCDACTHAPGRWGKTFLAIGEKIAEVVRASNPQTEILVSTWLMDETERKMVYALCDAGTPWFNGIMAGAEHMNEHPLPARYQRLVFPEISMFDCYFTSYGCNGANPAPERFAAESTRITAAGWGTALYSEGIYTDLNKAVYVARLWDKDAPLDRILDDYARYFFGTAGRKDAVALLRGLEGTWGAAKLQKADRKTVDRLAALAGSLKTKLPTHRDAQERWRMLSDRTEMDRLMKQIGHDAPLVDESRQLFDGLGYMPLTELRPRLKRFVAALQARKQGVESLFEVHWRYMEYFHMEKTSLVFLPDSMLGKYHWDNLLAPLEKALAQKSEEATRRQISRAFKRWFWFNGVDYTYLFGCG